MKTAYAWAKAHLGYIVATCFVGDAGIECYRNRPKEAAVYLLAATVFAATAYLRSRDTHSSK
jgi:hypothetical protein